MRLSDAPIPDGWIDAMAQVPDVSRQKFDFVCDLIKAHFEFRLSEIDKWAELLELR